MIRLLCVVLVLLFVGAGLSGCEEDQSSEAAELGIQEGRRPVSDKRPPPGPGGDAGFQEGGGDQLPEEPPAPPDN